MQDQLDPVDGALESLRGRQWPGDYNNPQLKDKLMQEFQTKRSTFGLSRRASLAATLALLLLGTAGFAAAGGVEMVREWFITVEIDGEVVDVEDLEVTSGTDGATTHITIDVPAQTMMIERTTPDETDEAEEMDEGAVAEARELTLTLKAEPAADIPCCENSAEESASPRRTIVIETNIVDERCGHYEADDESEVEPLVITVPVDPTETEEQ